MMGTRQKGAIDAHHGYASQNAGGAARRSFHRLSLSACSSASTNADNQDGGTDGGMVQPPALAGRWPRLRCREQRALDDTELAQGPHLEPQHHQPVGEDWLLQTPPRARGACLMRSLRSRPPALARAAMPTSSCASAQSQSDCTGGGTCTAVAATVRRPGRHRRCCAWGTRISSMTRCTRSWSAPSATSTSPACCPGWTLRAAMRKRRHLPGQDRALAARPLHLRQLSLHRRHRRHQGRAAEPDPRCRRDLDGPGIRWHLSIEQPAALVESLEDRGR